MLKTYQKKLYRPIILLAIALLPIFTVFGLSDAARAEMDNLENEYYSLKPTAMEIFEDMNTFFNQCEAEIIADMDLYLLDDIYSNVRGRNIVGLMDALIDNVNFTGTCETDASDLRNRVDNNLNDFINNARDWQSFVSNEINNLRFSDAYPLFEDNQDISLEMLKVFDNFLEIVRKSDMGSFEDVVLNEFTNQVDLAFNYQELLLNNLDNRLQTKLNDITSSGQTNAEKIAAYQSLYLLMTNTVLSDMQSFHQEIQTTLNNNQLKQYIANQKADAMNELEYAILTLLRHMLLEIGVDEVHSELGDDPTDFILDLVYGVEMLPNQHGLIDSDKDIVIFGLYNNKAAIESLLTKRYGEFEFEGLVGQTIKTGTILKVTDQNQTMIEYVFVVKGDLLGRATSDITDLITLIEVVLGDRTLSGAFIKAADLNNDNELDITDIVQLIDLILTK